MAHQVGGQFGGQVVGQSCPQVAPLVSQVGCHFWGNVGRPAAFRKRLKGEQQPVGKGTELKERDYGKAW